MFDRSVVRVAALFDFYQENPLEVEKINLFFNNRKDRAAALAKMSRLPLSLASSLAGNLEINDRNANKGEGLRILCGHLGIPMEQVIAVGDNSNDFGLLQAATGYSKTAVNNWCGSGILKAFKRSNVNHIPKVYLIEFLCSPDCRSIIVT